ncbi:MAG: hypothetical protein ACLPVY_03555 [Acidimicrobiia bacterium]
MSVRTAAKTALAALGAVAVAVGLSATAGAVGVPAPVATRHSPTNVERAFRVAHCIVHYEFGNFGGIAYAKARAAHEDRGYICTVQSSVIVARGWKVFGGPKSVFTCGARKKGCLPTVYLKWAQSTVRNAIAIGADVQVNEIRAWPPPHTAHKDSVLVFVPPF